MDFNISIVPFEGVVSMWSKSKMFRLALRPGIWEMGIHYP